MTQLTRNITTGTWSEKHSKTNLTCLVFKEHLHKKWPRCKVRNSNRDLRLTHTLHLTITQNGHISMQFDPLQIWSVNKEGASRLLQDNSISLLPFLDPTLGLNTNKTYLEISILVIFQPTYCNYLNIMPISNCHQTRYSFFL